MSDEMIERARPSLERRDEKLSELPFTIIRAIRHLDDPCDRPLAEIFVCTISPCDVNIFACYIFRLFEDIIVCFRTTFFIR